MKTQSVGELLKKERTKHSVSVKQLSQKTRIRESHIRALEANQFDQLPAAVFVKGYIKAYATLLGFEYQPVIALLRRDYRESSKGTLIPREFMKPLLQRRKSRSIPMTFMFGIIFFVTVSSYVSFQWYNAQRAPEIELFSPLDQALVGPTLTVVGQTQPDAILKINGQPTALQIDGSFSTEVFLEKEGINTISVTASDENDKMTTVERVVYVQF